MTFHHKVGNMPLASVIYVCFHLFFVQLKFVSCRSSVFIRKVTAKCYLTKSFSFVIREKWHTCIKILFLLNKEKLNKLICLKNTFKSFTSCDTTVAICNAHIIVPFKNQHALFLMLHLQHIKSARANVIVTWALICVRCF